MELTVVSTRLPSCIAASSLRGELHVNTRHGREMEERSAHTYRETGTRRGERERRSTISTAAARPGQGADNGARTYLKATRYTHTQRGRARERERERHTEGKGERRAHAVRREEEKRRLRTCLD